MVPAGAGRHAAAANVMTVRRALVFVLLAANLGFVAGPSSAASPQALVLRGSRSGSTVVDFAKPVTFEMYDAGGDGYARGVTATHAGGYAGIAVRRADGRLVFARFVVRGFETTDRTFRYLVTLGDLHDNVVVPAGRYRVSLLTDGASELRIRTRGLSGTRVLAPVGPERFRGQRLDLRVGGVAPVGYGKVEDVEVRERAIPVLAEFDEFPQSTYSRVDYCFTNRPDCAVSETGYGGGEHTGTAGAAQLGFGSSWVPAGRYDVLFRFAGTGLPVGVSGFVAVLD